jgi:hypothetical protein
MMKCKIYRSVTPKPDTTARLHEFRPTTRLPGNVPYLVDNLWEWKRPDEFPNRRNSVFASPDPGSARDSGPKKGTVYCVEFVGNYKICQLKEFVDSKLHHECKSLPKVLLDCIGQKWLDSSLSEKKEAGQLWIPGLSKAEVEYLFENVAILKSVRFKVFNSINYWNDVILINNKIQNIGSGELFFEAVDGYYLRDLYQKKLN